MDWSTIVAVVEDRRRAQADSLRKMAEVRDRVNGDMLYAYPEVGDEPSMRMMAPQIVLDAINSTAARAGSVLPTVVTPDYPDSSTKGARRRARDRRKAWYGVWHRSNFPSWSRRALRHLYGYGTMAVVVGFDDSCGMPSIELRDPLGCFPEPRSPEEYRAPLDCGFVSVRSAAWLVSMFSGHPKVASMTRSLRGGDTVEMLEWYDAGQRVIGVLRVRPAGFGAPAGASNVDGGFELARSVNRAGVCPVAAGNMVTLDQIVGRAYLILGAADMLERLTGLWYLAAERSVFGDVVALGDNGQIPQLINPPFKDGRTGEVNFVIGAKDIRRMNAEVPSTVPIMASQLERAARQTAGHPGLLSGELTGSLRSGQTVNALGQVALDPHVAEVQDVFRYQLMTLNRLVADVWNGYAPDRTVRMFSGWHTDRGVVDVTPRSTFETTENDVSYALAGADSTSISYAIGTRVGQGIMSRRTARAMDPMISDEDAEEAQQTSEALLDALLAGVQQQLQSGTMPPEDGARIVALMADGKDLPWAIAKASKEAQERQATIAPPSTDGMAAAPGAMPGLGAPGQGMEMAPAPIPEPDRGLLNQRMLVNALLAGRPRTGG